MNRVAYLNTEYPSLSHTFIEREVRAVCSEGVEVHTFSVRRPGVHARLSAEHDRAAQETVCILGSGWELLRDAAATAIGRPRGFMRAVVASQRLSPPGLRDRVKHLAYVVEAMRLARLMRARGLWHVHVHMANNGAAVALLATKVDPRIGYSLSIHGSAEFFHVDTWRLKEKVEGAVFVRCISDFCRAQVMAWTDPAAWERLSVVRCGVDTERYRRRGGWTRDKALRLLTVGRLHPIKGYPLLLGACAGLSARGLEWTLDMVGEGPIRGALEAQARRLGIAERVTFSGAVGQDKIREHFERADVMVVSSFMEGVPVVLMEAMSMELAVLSTAVGGVPELVEAGVSGRLVPPGSPEALLGALLELVEVATDRARLAEMGAAGRRRVIESYDGARVGREMAGLFSRHLARRLGQDERSQRVHEVAETACAG